MNSMALTTKTSVLILAALLPLTGSGCKSKPHPAAAGPVSIVTPNYSLAAKVVSVNTVGRFVVLNFPLSQMPKMDQTLFLYRAGLKVGQVRITGPQQNSNIVADLVSGEAQAGDNVRDQ